MNTRSPTQPSASPSRPRTSARRYNSRPLTPSLLPMTENHVRELVDLLELERLEDNLFRGQSRDIGTHFVFGGQVLGQALSAAQRTVDPRREAHSLHAYFLRAGDINAPI